jgi:hypothetical protein
MPVRFPLCTLLCLAPLAARADPPVVEAVAARHTTSGWTFDVTLSHPDTSWEHYADGWRVLDMNGNELGLRILYHPHVEEQPFTRSLGPVQIPDGTEQVRVQARCLVDGWSGDSTIVTLR